MSTMTLSIKLQGLCCSNCANKIEKRTSKLKKVSSVHLNFAQAKLDIECPASDKGEVLDQVSSIVKALEPDVDVFEITADTAAPLSSDLFNINEAKASGQNTATDQAHSHSHTHGHDHGHSHEGHTKRRRNIIFLSLFLYIAGLLATHYNMETWIVISLLGTAYILVGFKVIKKSINNIRHGEIFDENFLMSIASLGAIGIGEYPEAVAVMIFYEIGEYFQELAVGKSRSSIAALMDIKPTFAHLISHGTVKTVAPEAVKIGDIIMVKPGEAVPVDGKVIDGDSNIDAAAITGESIPISILPGDEVLSGSINLNKVIKMEVTKLYKDSTVARILDLVENASGQKSKTENFITKFAAIYTPIVVIMAAVIAIVPPLFFGQDPSTYIYSALIFLVISCPCALVVSVPLGFYSGIGNASKHGVLVKGGNYLEALNGIDTLLFDKTGTLTKGNFAVSSIETSKKYHPLEVLKYAAIGESFSNHPIGKSIIRYYQDAKKDYEAQGISYVPLDQLHSLSHEEISGQGLKLDYQGKTLLIGNHKLMKNNGVHLPEISNTGTLVYLSMDQTYAGALVIEDELKPDAKKAIEGLQTLGLNDIIMLTGDNEKTAKDVASKLSIHQYAAELLPEDKYNYMLAKKKEGKRVAFVGDGINDAPVLAASDVGISMGGIGSDVAIEASDVVLMTDEPSALVAAIKISKKTKRVVSQNIVLALTTKVGIMGLSLIGIGTMWMAIFADVGIALIAVLNATRVLAYRPK